MSALRVVKRDGSVVDFDKEKIRKAIAGAFDDIKMEVDDSYLDKLVDHVCQSIQQDEIQVEDIQDIVEHWLMREELYDVAKAYIIYRYRHEIMRNNNLMNEIGKKLTASNIENQNANIDEHSFGGRKGEADNVLMKQYALEHCMSKMSRENHLNNEIYIHDLDSYAVGMHNCMSIPFDDLLANGFNTRQTDVRPANSINTAFQLVAVIFQLQSLQQFGGCSATHLDWTMVPYVRKSFFKHFKDGCHYCHDIEDWSCIAEDFNDQMSIEDDKYKEYQYAYEYALNMTIKEIHQAVEGMYHNLSD